MIVQSEPMMEVRLEPSNAEWAISVTESGRAIVLRVLQYLKSSSEIFVSCDGVSNLIHFNLV
jgi:hypothetical protein